MVKLIDCTIRDGGHINNWNFSCDCVKASYLAAKAAGAEYFEVGYRNSVCQNSVGAFAFCNDDLLFKIFGQEPDCKIAVMADTGKSDIKDFNDCDSSLTPVSLVRVATYPQNLKSAFDFCLALKNKGYDVFLNLMAISEFKEENFETIEKWNDKQILEGVCFADSFGSFFPADVEKFYTKLKNLGFENISFHSHNNLQLAFANTLKAIELGVYSVDSTIYGMGRDAGNLPSELITAYFQKHGNKKYNPEPYFDVIENYYLKLSKEYEWGYSLHSLLGGFNDVHPEYVNRLNSQKNISTDNIWEILDKDKKNIPPYFSNKVLEEISRDNF